MSQARNRTPKLSLVVAADETTAPAPHQGPYARSFDRRRQEILATTWEMIAEHGGEEFNLTELSKRSGVALRTIYNAFQDRDGLIAQAVATHYHSLFGGIEILSNESHTLEEAIEMCARVATETARVKAFSATAARMYFAARTNPRLVETLRRLPLFILKSWLRSDEVDSRLVSRFGRERLERSFANTQWGAVNDWAAGRLDDHDLAREMKSSILQIAMAFGNRAGRAAAKRLCRDYD